MIACSKEQLLVFDNSPVLLRAPGKRPQEATPQTLRNCVFLKSLVQDTHSPQSLAVVTLDGDESPSIG